MWNGREARVTDMRFKASDAYKLDAPERLVWLPPSDVVRALRLHPGQVVADIGAGTGYFSLPIRRAVGSSGRVLALDAQKEMLAHLREKMERHSEAGIDLIHAEADKTTLPASTCDLVFMANVWHEFAERLEVLRETLRILRRPGRVAILDWRPDVEREAGPPLEHRIPVTAASEELCSAGFEGIEYCNVGKYSWLVQGFTPTAHG